MRTEGMKSKPVLKRHAVASSVRFGSGPVDFEPLTHAANEPRAPTNPRAR
jgi:hypothetical protein